MRSHRSAGQGILAGLLALLLLGPTGCATNPVTGERELALVGEEQEIQMGKEADQQVVASMGVVQDDGLQTYVKDLGSELAAVSERPDLPWTFRVIDDPTVNAFALPGGFVYVTRGMLTHLDSEAQLAGILGHEIGHVTARHSVNQMSRAQLANLGLGLGMVLVPELQQFGDLAGASMQLLFLKFSRDDENQSDELGVRYMTDLGYEPAELSQVFGMLERLSAQSGSTLPAWASTHPAPGDRRSRILAMADTFPGADRVLRPALLDRVDGLVFGSNPRNGFFDGGAFHHPELAFRFDVPSSWEGMNGSQAVQLVGPDQEAAVILRLSEASGPRAAAEAFASENDLQVTGSREESIHGLPAAWITFTASTDGGDLHGVAAFPLLDGRVYTLYGFAPSGSWSRHRDTVAGVLGSFRRETDAQVLNVRPEVVDVVDLDGPLSLSAFLDRYPAVEDRSTLALINQVWETERLPGGPAKRVVRD